MNWTMTEPELLHRRNEAAGRYLEARLNATRRQCDPDSPEWELALEMGEQAVMAQVELDACRRDGPGDS